MEETLLTYSNTRFCNLLLAFGGFLKKEKTTTDVWSTDKNHSYYNIYRVAVFDRSPRLINHKSNHGISKLHAAVYYYILFFFSSSIEKLSTRKPSPKNVRFIESLFQNFFS